MTLLLAATPDLTTPPPSVRMTGTGTVIPADRTATMLAPAAMPGYGAAGGATIDYDRLAGAIGRVAGTHIAVDARGQGADAIAKKVERRQRRRERAAGL